MNCRKNEAKGSLKNPHSQGVLHMRSTLKMLVAFLLATSTLSAQTQTSDGAKNFLIRGKWVWDGTGKPPVPGGVVLVRGDRIVAVGNEQEVKAPADAVVIDKRNLFLMPGLVDGHEHFGLDQFAGLDTPGLIALPAPYLALRAVRNGRTALRSGVTTARVPGEKDFLDVSYKRAFNEGLVPGPRILAGARWLRPPDGFPNWPGLGRPFSGVDDVRLAVRENIVSGADLCKMFISGRGVPGLLTPTIMDAIYFNKQEIEAIVEECHRHRKPVTAHVIKGGPSFEWALAAGVDAFEHGMFLTRDEIQKIKEHGAFLVIGETRAFLPGGGYPKMPPPPNGEEIVRNWYTNVFAVRPKLAVSVDQHQGPGALAKEIAVLVRYGLTNEEALLIATRNGGDLTGLPVGTLEPNKYADVIGIQGNPLEDIKSLEQVGFVMKGGKVYELSEE